MDTVGPAGAPDLGTLLPTGWAAGPSAGRFPWRNEAGDLQQTQGAQPLEGQRRDALEGVVAEDPEGREKGREGERGGQRKRIGVRLGCRAGRGGRIIRSREETSGGDRSGHNLNCGGGSMGVSVSQNASNDTMKYVQVSVY